MRRRKNYISAERLRELIEYDSTTGLFRWLNPNQGKGKRGQIINGWKSGNYLAVGLDNNKYYLHVLAWLYSHNKLPKDQLDHINLDKHDNRLSNLREATASQNGANVCGRNKSGFKGVYYEKRSNRYYALICKNRRQINLGTFDTPQEANNAYYRAAKELFGEFARSA